MPPEPEELELILETDGTTTVNLCSACLLGEKDDRCKVQQVDFIQEMIKDGHVAKVINPEEPVKP